MMTDVVLIESGTFRLELCKDALERLGIQRTRRIIGLVEDPAALSILHGWVQDKKEELAKEGEMLDFEIRLRKGPGNSGWLTRKIRRLKQIKKRLGYLSKTETALDKRRKELGLNGWGD